MSDRDQGSKTDHPSPGPNAIWAPWRLPYLESLSDDPAPPTDSTQPSPPAATAAETSPSTTNAPPHPSFLRQYWQDPTADHANHVLIRDNHGMVLLNKFPYANGHLLVALGDARPRLLDYDPMQRAALWAMVDTACDLLERTLNPQGVNIGVNQARAAGAGVPQHLHVHLVPRWNGDVNFITTVGEVRVIPSALDAMARRFRATLSS